MIGWVPHVMAAFLDEVAGVDVRRTVLAEAGFAPDVGFRLHADYPDAACRRILDAACRNLGVTEEQAFALFAPFFLARARGAFPAFFAARPCLRDFLLHQPTIHETLSAGLAAGRRGEVAAKFRVEATAQGVRVFYRSPNRLAGLYAAIADCLGRELGQPVTVRFEAGGPSDPECILLVDIESASDAATAGIAELAA